jgi:hypothetical protein
MTPPRRRGSIDEVNAQAPPTVRQIYALAAILCVRYGQEFPATRGDASRLIERLRFAQGHPAPRLEDLPLPPPRRRRRRGANGFARAVAAEVARELKVS